MKSQRSSFSASSGEDDQILQDCFDLRKKLIQTEQSLQELHINATPYSELQPGVMEQSPKSDEAPLLTVADLSPSQSRSFNKTKSMDNDQWNSYFPVKVNKKQNVLSDYSVASLDDAMHLRRKLSHLREENSVLFSQNNKLMTELESRTYQLHECQEEMKILSKKTQNEMNDKYVEHENEIEVLHNELEKKNLFTKELQDVVYDLKDQLKNKTLELQQECERLHNENGDHLSFIERLSEKYSTLEKELITAQSDNITLKAESDSMKSKLVTCQQENEEQKNKYNLLNEEKIELEKTHQKLEKDKEKKERENKNLSLEIKNLKSVVASSEETIKKYEADTKNTRQHMNRLETLIQKIQEEKLNTSSRPDSGIGFASDSSKQLHHSLITSLQPLHHSFSHPEEIHSSPRSVIADLRLKLALKEKEIHRLTSSLKAVNANQQKINSDSISDEWNMTNLKTELNSLKEKIHLHDKKEMEYEQHVTQQQEEMSKKSALIVELKDRMTEKASLIAALENKLNLRNDDVNRLEDLLSQNKSEYQKKISKLKLDIEKLKKSNKDIVDASHIANDQKKRSDQMIKSYTARITELESAITIHQEEIGHTNELLERMKSLHNEHSNELQKEALNLNEQLKVKSDLLLNLEKDFDKLSEKHNVSEKTAKDLTQYVSHMDELLKEKEKMCTVYDEKIKELGKVLADKEKEFQSLKDEMKNMTEELDNSKNKLHQTKLEIDERNQKQEEEFFKKNCLIDNLQNEINIKNAEATELKNSINEHLLMISQNQQHISDLEGSVSKYENETNLNAQLLLKSETRFGLELSTRDTDIIELKKLLKMYEEQNMQLNEALDGARSKLADLGDTLNDNENKLQEQQQLVEDQNIEIENNVKIIETVQDELDEQTEENNKLLHSLKEKDSIISQKTDEIKQNQDKLARAEEDLKRTYSKLRDCDVNYEDISKKLSTINNSKNKLERMLTIMQDEAGMKEKETRDVSAQLVAMQQLMKQQDLELQRKSAQIAQLEMSFKEEKSEFEKSVYLLEQAMQRLREAIKERDATITELDQERESLREKVIISQELCQQYNEKLKLNDQMYMDTMKEVHTLKEELSSCQLKIKDIIKLETEISARTIANQQLEHQNRALESRFKASQQSSLKLKEELDKCQHFLSLKEAECLQMARDLGATQLRESQDQYRTRNEVSSLRQQYEKELDEKKTELEELHEKLDDANTKQKQEIMTLRLALHRSDNENELYKSDVERYKERVIGLEKELQSLLNELQTEQKKTRELDEVIVLKESEIARFSSQLDGISRATLKGVTPYQTPFPSVRKTESYQDETFDELKSVNLSDSFT